MHYLTYITSTMKPQNTLTDQMFSRLEWKAATAKRHAAHAYKRAAWAFVLLALSLALNALLLFL